MDGKTGECSEAGYNSDFLCIHTKIKGILCLKKSTFGVSGVWKYIERSAKPMFGKYFGWYHSSEEEWHTYILSKATKPVNHSNNAPCILHPRMIRIKLSHLPRIFQHTMAVACESYPFCGYFLFVFTFKYSLRRTHCSKCCATYGLISPGTNHLYYITNGSVDCKKNSSAFWFVLRVSVVR